MIWVWLGWFSLTVILFAIFETYALKTGRMTLSRFTFTIGLRWPLFLVLWGMIVGGLAVHFFWHWCPPGSGQGG